VVWPTHAGRRTGSHPCEVSAPGSGRSVPGEVLLDLVDLEDGRRRRYHRCGRRTAGTPMTSALIKFRFHAGQRRPNSTPRPSPERLGGPIRTAGSRRRGRVVRRCPSLVAPRTLIRRHIALVVPSWSPCHRPWRRRSTGSSSAARGGPVVVVPVAPPHVRVAAVLSGLGLVARPRRTHSRAKGHLYPAHPPSAPKRLQHMRIATLGCNRIRSQNATPAQPHEPT
jgi:hypothetical protein